jgi:hypothetical protein
MSLFWTCHYSTCPVIFFGLVLKSYATSAKLPPANVRAVGGAVMGFVSVHLLLVFFSTQACLRQVDVDRL